VAVYSQGCTVTFKGTPLGESVTVTMNRGSGMPTGRDANAFAYAASYGSVSVETLSGVAIYGDYGDLSISGGGISLTEKAVCTGVSAVAQVNDVTRYSVTFELIV